MNNSFRPLQKIAKKSPHSVEDIRNEFAEYFLPTV